MTRVFATAAGDTLSVGISGRFDGGDRTVRATVGDVDLPVATPDRRLPRSAWAACSRRASDSLRASSGFR